MMLMSNWITLVFGILSLIFGAISLNTKQATFDIPGKLLKSMQHAVISSAIMIQFGVIISFHALLGIFVAGSYHKALLFFYEVLSTYPRPNAKLHTQTISTCIWLETGRLQ